MADLRNCPNLLKSPNVPRLYGDRLIPSASPLATHQKRLQTARAGRSARPGRGRAALRASAGRGQVEGVSGLDPSPPRVAVVYGIATVVGAGLEAQQVAKRSVMPCSLARSSAGSARSTVAASWAVTVTGGLIV